MVSGVASMIAQTKNMMETTFRAARQRFSSHDKDLPEERSPGEHFSEGDGVF
jgi:hypothetical protein